MSAALTEADVLAIAGRAGYAIAGADAARVARAIGPALQAFAAVEASLPFEAEPAGFVAVQSEARP